MCLGMPSKPPLPRRSTGLRVAAAVLAAGLGVPAAAAPGPESLLEPAAIVSPASASPLEALAAREVRRYFYVRTGVVLPIFGESDAPQIVVARRDRPLARALGDAKLGARLDRLVAQERLLLTLARRPGVLLVTGGDDAGVLYAAYRLAEHLGVRFGLHGDTIPDGRQPASIPALDEAARPLFPLRGIQPFHDFPEGPDWWTRDDYKAVLAQLPKLGMNFVGLHTYPEGRPNAEPTVWIGTADEIGAGPQVKAAYPSSYFTTERGNWGYDPRPTSRYSFGFDLLFPRDAYGNDVMEGLEPQPATAEGERTLFARAAEVLADAFGFAHRLATKTCVGTETPLVVPRAVKERLAARGNAAGAPLQQLYEGLFRRIAQSYPLDYYWLWTPEAWTWDGVKDEDVRSTLADVRSALAAARAVSAPFSLATCGWVLGPPQDRTLFDRELPRTSCSRASTAPWATLPWSAVSRT